MLQVHLVHVNTEKYKTAEEAVKHADGLCVLGVFLQVMISPLCHINWIQETYLLNHMQKNIYVYTHSCIF